VHVSPHVGGDPDELLDLIDMWFRDEDGRMAAMSIQLLDLYNETMP